MDPIDHSVPSPEQRPAEPIASQPTTRTTGFRRAALTAGMAAALLVAGGVAAVSAASPDPSASPSGSPTTEPATDGTTSSGTTQDASRPDCPNEDGDAVTPSTTPTPTS